MSSNHRTQTKLCHSQKSSNFCNEDAESSNSFQLLCAQSTKDKTVSKGAKRNDLAQNKTKSSFKKNLDDSFDLFIPNRVKKVMSSSSSNRSISSRTRSNKRKSPYFDDENSLDLQNEDEDMEYALQLSMLDSGSTANLPGPSNFLGKKDSRSKKLCSVPLLLRRTPAEREKIITEKVAIVLMDDKENKIEKELHNKGLLSNNLKQEFDVNSRLWKLSQSQINDVDTCNFYVKPLSKYDNNGLLCPNAHSSTDHLCQNDYLSVDGKKSPDRTAISQNKNEVSTNIPEEIVSEVEIHCDKDSQSLTENRGNESSLSVKDMFQDSLADVEVPLSTLEEGDRSEDQNNYYDVSYHQKSDTSVCDFSSTKTVSEDGDVCSTLDKEKPSTSGCNFNTKMKTKDANNQQEELMVSFKSDAIYGTNLQIQVGDMQADNNSSKMSIDNSYMCSNQFEAIQKLSLVQSTSTSGLYVQQSPSHVSELSDYITIVNTDKAEDLSNEKIDSESKNYLIEVEDELCSVKSASSTKTLELHSSDVSLHDETTLDGQVIDNSPPQFHIKELCELELKALQGLSNDLEQAWLYPDSYLVSVICSDHTLTIQSCILFSRCPLIFREVRKHKLQWEHYNRTVCEVFFRYVVTGKIDHFKSVNSDSLFTLFNISSKYQLNILSEVVAYHLNKGIEKVSSSNFSIKISNNTIDCTTNISTDDEDAHEQNMLKRSRRFFIKESNHPIPCYVVDSDDDDYETKGKKTQKTNWKKQLSKKYRSEFQPELITIDSDSNHSEPNILSIENNDLSQILNTLIKNELDDNQWRIPVPSTSKEEVIDLENDFPCKILEGKTQISNNKNNFQNFFERSVNFSETIPNTSNGCEQEKVGNDISSFKIENTFDDPKPGCSGLSFNKIVPSKQASPKFYDLSAKDTELLDEPQGFSGLLFKGSKTIKEAIQGSSNLSNKDTEIIYERSPETCSDISLSETEPLNEQASNSSKLYKTREGQVVTLSHKIIPPLDYTPMSSTEFKKELMKYGIKPSIEQNKAVHLLNCIYLQLDANKDDTIIKSTSKIHKVSENTDQLSTFLSSRSPWPDDQKDDVNHDSAKHSTSLVVNYISDDSVDGLLPNDGQMLDNLHYHNELSPKSGHLDDMKNRMSKGKVKPEQSNLFSHYAKEEMNPQASKHNYDDANDAILQNHLNVSPSDKAVSSSSSVNCTLSPNKIPCCPKPGDNGENSIDCYFQDSFPSLRHFETPKDSEENASNECRPETPVRSLSSFKEKLNELVQKTPEYSSFTETGPINDHLSINSKLYATPGGQLITFSDKATPQPDYNLMTPTELKKELRKYGIKPNLEQKKAVNLLNYIYLQLHPRKDSTVVKSTISQIREVSENTGCADDQLSSHKSSSSIKSLWPNEEKATFNHDSAKPSTSYPVNYFSDDSVDGSLSNDTQMLDDLNYHDEVSPVSAQLVCTIVQFIRRSLLLKREILLYKPIWLVKFQNLLKEHGIKCSIKDLKAVLNHIGIIYKTERLEKRN
ncbi:uncharacterized protein LOC106663886 isoform X2 [Cimex lectularius]|uniref:Structure-specific endonuclease subunit SLX4 n=1 Tax=Cimex lectularius TaxID=79782 RepID=A0A8I6RJS1_CIMLE|nr:uncharacterized protein LOC106663886 isoform X2 [Cimex lectularius]